MASGTGLVTINLGTGKGVYEASITFSDTLISATSKVEAFIMADTTTDHTALDHRFFNALVSLTCSTPTAGVGGTIYSTSLYPLVGTFKVRYVWAD